MVLIIAMAVVVRTATGVIGSIWVTTVIAVVAAGVIPVPVVTAGVIPIPVSWISVGAITICRRTKADPYSPDAN
jgi:hypothetical protein